MAATFTLFACRLSRAADVPKQLLGAFAGVIHCDRARMYWAFDKLQYCWAHLKRDFQGLIDSPCGVRRRLGHDLMRPTKEMFRLWQKVRDGTLSRAEFQQQMQAIRERCGERAVAWLLQLIKCVASARTCGNIVRGCGYSWMWSVWSRRTTRQSVRCVMR